MKTANITVNAKWCWWAKAAIWLIRHARWVAVPIVAMIGLERFVAYMAKHGIRFTCA